MWQEVIVYAKCAFHAYVTGQCGFPDPVAGLQGAGECFKDALEVHKEGEGTVEPGEYGLCCMLLDLMWKPGYVINKDMAMLVHSQP